jgi:predicted CopG family antitoxin
MAVKTITVTEDAYNALKGMKEPRESFSETILRVSKRRPLMSFFGILKGESGEKFEKAIMDARKKEYSLYKERIKHVIKERRK